MTSQEVSDMFKAFLAGGVAGCCAKTMIAPLDRVKILLQAQNEHYRHLSVASSITAVVKKEGFWGLYKGNGAMMIRIFPYGAIQFVSYERYKKMALSWLGQDSHVARLMAGSLAGVTAVLFTYPLDMIRARLAFQVSGEHIYTGIIHTFHSIWHQEGKMKGFYRGFIPTFMGMIPYAGIAFYTYETGKRIALDHGPKFVSKPSPSQPDVKVLTTPCNLFVGGVAGAIAQTVSYPLDVARRKMQLGHMLANSHQFGNWMQVLLIVYQRHGLRKGLYRGLSINYVRAIPSVAVSFTVYEFMKQLLNIQPKNNSL
ncbi:solute carrier family 25 member 16-like [Antedon mediterranea]|uniref:solute carrier family 25 member 16-like n=1 Tax=Antedon mediterranea TaxID=105859 RepID=UPI003AF64647